jgi:hypothetical protein
MLPIRGPPHNERPSAPRVGEICAARAPRIDCALLCPDPDMIDPRRRRFLAGGLAAGTIGCAPIANAAFALRELTAPAFAPFIGTAFAARALASADAQALQLVLSSVDPLDASRPSSRSFALTFEVVGTAAPQSTYALTHPALGAFAALLVPNRNGTALTAIFNRLA